MAPQMFSVALSAKGSGTKHRHFSPQSQVILPLFQYFSLSPWQFYHNGNVIKYEKKEYLSLRKMLAPGVGGKLFSVMVLSFRFVVAVVVCLLLLF